MLPWLIEFGLRIILFLFQSSEDIGTSLSVEIPTPITLPPLALAKAIPLTLKKERL